MHPWAERRQTDVLQLLIMLRCRLQKWRSVALVIAVGAGHHRISFDVLKLAIGKAASPYSAYFDRCRRKRNVIDYDDALVASETEVKEIVAKAKEFVDVIEQWIAKNHSSLKA